MGQVRVHMALHPPSTLALSGVTVMEIEFGLAQVPAKRAAVEAALALWLPQVAVLDYRAGDARVTASIRAALKAQGTPIGPYDLLNAGMTLARGLTLVTHNSRESRRVAGFPVVDWVEGELRWKCPDHLLLALAFARQGHLTRMTPVLTLHAPALAALTPDTALNELRALACMNPTVARRLRRVGRLLAAGRAVRVAGSEAARKAVWTALRAYEARELSVHPELRRIPVMADELLTGLRAPTHVLLSDPAGQPSCEYLISPEEGGVVRVRCSDRRVRTLSGPAFTALFKGSSYRLMVREGQLAGALLPRSPAASRPAASK
ncbi:VapC toxin protein [Deinococcus marmoris]|uniref:VapC toxin protein n=2 Tax=Deinococcus marmoris TaxID=249408 RepID=A0A1U7NTY2_9DEIO|nr:VapC toxin protein [Deinococcus marmoris]